MAKECKISNSLECEVIHLDTESGEHTFAKIQSLKDSNSIELSLKELYELESWIISAINYIEDYNLKDLITHNEY